MCVLLPNQQTRVGWKLSMNVCSVGSFWQKSGLKWKAMWGGWVEGGRHFSEHVVGIFFFKGGRYWLGAHLLGIPPPLATSHGSTGLILLIWRHPWVPDAEQPSLERERERERDNKICWGSFFFVVVVVASRPTRSALELNWTCVGHPVSCQKFLCALRRSGAKTVRQEIFLVTHERARTISTRYKLVGACVSRLTH